MIPDEYIGVNPYGLESKMSRIIITENLCLPLATINHTDTYTLTIWIKSNSNKTIELYYGSNVEYFDVTTEWKRFEFIFDPSTNDEVGLELSVGTYFIWHAKLEKGNKPTDWTPAPEDVKREAETYTDSKFSITDEKIESEVRRVNELNQKMTKFEQDSEGFTWNIDETAIISSDMQYYKSTSPTECVGGSWSTNKPVWSVGTYIWMRTRHKNGAGEFTYGAEVCVTDDVRIGGENLLSDTDVPSMTKIAGPGDKYLSDAANSTYSNGRFVSISDPPDPYFTHAYELECTTASSTPTAGRSLCFYSGKKVPMDNEETYTMSMYARKVSGDGKIRFLVGYDKYPNYNNYIEVTSEWKRYSYTFVYRNLDFHKNESTYGGARCYFGASCAVVGKVQICGFKLEKGNKVSDWRPSSNDVRYATDEASKTATNYMKFNSDGLTIGNMMESTLGKNVLIDSDSVDIRNGSQVLASYGENITLKHGGKDVLTIKDSTFLQELVLAGGFIESDSEVVTKDSSGNVISVKLDYSSSPKSFSKDVIYVWHILAVDRYTIFKFSTTYSKITGLYWESDTPAFLDYTHTDSNGDSFISSIACAYHNNDISIDSAFKGSVWIENDSDVNGRVKSIPPLGIGTRGGEHLEIDGNEITAKANDITPSQLYLNMEGGAVSINNNTFGLKIDDGTIYCRPVYEGNYSEILKCDSDVGTFSDVPALLIGQGSYNKNTTKSGPTYIKGKDVKIQSRSDIKLVPDDGDVVATSSFVVPNGSSYIGTNTSGVLRNNFQPCNANDNCVIGYGSYNSNEGSTNIYGKEIQLYADRYHDVDVKAGYFKVAGRFVGWHVRLWNGCLYMKADQSVTLSNSITNFATGIVLAFSYYDVDSNKGKDWDWEYFFVPRHHVTYYEGKGVAFGGSNSQHSIYWTKYLYISDTAIKGHANNVSTGTGADGITYKNNNKVLRAVYGV